MKGKFSIEPIQDYFFLEFEKLVKIDYKHNDVLAIKKYANGNTGSNPFSAVLVNRIARNHGKKILSPFDFSRRSTEDLFILKRKCLDLGLVLRDENDFNLQNNVLAEDLAIQVKQGGYDFRGDNPLVIPCSELDLVNADNYYGLSFRLRGDSKLFNAPELGDDKNKKRFSRYNENGMPIYDDDGCRVVYTRDRGLSRLCLFDLNLYAFNPWLADSDYSGQILLAN
jgi:hypothetical protein